MSMMRLVLVHVLCCLPDDCASTWIGLQNEATANKQYKPTRTRADIINGQKRRSDERGEEGAFACDWLERIPMR